MLEIQTIPAFDDNYIWLLVDTLSQQASVVDPGDAQPVMAALADQHLRLTSILITHKHPDHTGGIATLLEGYPEAVVYAPLNESMRHPHQPLKQDDVVHIAGASLQVFDVPGHTEGHIAYYDGSNLFCGDTLFAGGCGRVFGGTHQQLYQSLQVITHLPSETLIYCAHEYTLDNLGFAQWVEPENQALQQRIKNDQQQREQGKATVPSRLQLELDTNPFLRTNQSTVIAAANRYANQTLKQGADVFRAIRTWKDREYD